MKFFSLLKALAYLGSGGDSKSITWIISPTEFRDMEAAQAFYTNPIFMSKEETAGAKFIPEIWNRVYQPRTEAYTYFFLENGRAMYDYDYKDLPSKLWPEWLKPYLIKNNLESF